MFEWLNIPYARKVLEFLEHHPPEFTHNQGVLYSSLDCRTSACIAGVACMLDPEVRMAQYGPDNWLPTVNGEVVDWAAHAAELMGLSLTQASLLFYQRPSDIKDICASGRTIEQWAVDTLRDWIERAEREQAQLAETTRGKMGIIGVVHHGPLEDSQWVRFGEEFLFCQPVAWSVDWSTAVCEDVRTCDPQSSPKDVLFPHCGPGCLAGASVTYNMQGQVLTWRLTGTYDPRTGLFDAERDDIL